MAKFSLFLLYLRLFSVNKKTRYLIYFGIVITGLFYLASMLVSIIVCSPWNGESRLVALGSTRCAQDKRLGYVMTVYNVCSDFYLLIVPIHIVSKLQMPTRKKIGVISLFMFGFL